jgi:TPR repeat protein
MRHYTQLLRAAVTASLMFVAIGAAVAGPLEDAEAAWSRHDYATAFRLFRLLADQGDATAQGNLGSMYAHGEGVTQSFAEAAKWFRLAADQGNATAQYKLGCLYDACGLTQDYAQAVRWYRRAADQGLAVAQFGLGTMYETGQGVPQDYVLAHMWFNLSAAQGNQAAALTRDDLANRMTRAQIVEAQKLAREWKPKPER